MTVGSWFELKMDTFPAAQKSMTSARAALLATVVCAISFAGKMPLDFQAVSGGSVTVERPQLELQQNKLQETVIGSWRYHCQE